MTPDSIIAWGQALAIAGGVMVGIFAVYSPSWVWLKIQKFGWGSAFLCAFGTILIVCPLYKEVTLGSSLLQLKFSELENRLTDAQASFNELKSALAEDTDKATKSARLQDVLHRQDMRTIARLEKFLYPGGLNDSAPDPQRKAILETALKEIDPEAPPCLTVIRDERFASLRAQLASKVLQ